MRKVLHLLIPIWCIVIVFFSCAKEQYCIGDVVAYLNAGFYTWDGGELVEKTIDTITVSGISFDSLIYDSEIDIESVELPLSNIYDTSIFMLKFQIDMPSIDRYRQFKFTDTLTIIYSRQMSLISPVCGFGYNYEILNATSTHNYIDSIHIVNRFVNVDEPEEENIEILF